MMDAIEHLQETKESPMTKKNLTLSAIVVMMAASTSVFAANTNVEKKSVKVNQVKTAPGGEMDNMDDSDNMGTYKREESTKVTKKPVPGYNKKTRKK